MNRLKIDGLVDGVRQEKGATLHVKRRGKWIIPDKPDRLALGLTAHNFHVYTDDYTDAAGRHPGEPGFIPLGAAAPPAGGEAYDHNYRDAQGHKPGDPEFVAPGPAAESPLVVGYTAAYRDAHGRQPGERGFIPPAAAAAGLVPSEAATKLPQGFDGFYRDADGLRLGDPGFRTGSCFSASLYCTVLKISIFVGKGWGLTLGRLDSRIFLQPKRTEGIPLRSAMVGKSPSVPPAPRWG